ncbi:flagellar hook capping protein [Opitutaceae bacterium TAV4]|nr:flagellar hook capping protein [Opitutaceae bacterium TAV4]RRK02615.1 flagellar hook capping protein [Opitutaceae bacterium TAV3]
MTVPAVTTTSATQEASASNSSTSITSTLGQADFFKLLSVQLQKQDPLNPVDDTQFLAQLAQFSALAQSEALVTQMGYLRADIQMQAAAGLVGKEVTVVSDGELVTGTVTSIAADSDAVYVKIGDTYYTYSSVIEVAEPPPAATT